MAGIATELMRHTSVMDSSAQGLGVPEQRRPVVQRPLRRLIADRPGCAGRRLLRIERPMVVLDDPWKHVDESAESAETETRDEESWDS